MAEKEERIRVLIAKNPCNECSVKKCTRKCTFGLLFEKAPGITGQEAIRKMCDAYFKAKDKGLMESERVLAALNALLEKGE